MGNTGMMGSSGTLVKGQCQWLKAKAAREARQGACFMVQCKFLFRTLSSKLTE